MDGACVSAERTVWYVLAHVTIITLERNLTSFSTLGVNLRGEYNDGNVTRYEFQDEEKVDAMDVDAEDEAAKKGDLSVYRGWSKRHRLHFC